MMPLVLDREVARVIALVVGYLAHSTAWVLGAWVVCRFVRLTAPARSLVWRATLVDPLASLALQAASGAAWRVEAIRTEPVASTAPPAVVETIGPAVEVHHDVAQAPSVRRVARAKVVAHRPAPKAGPREIPPAPWLVTEETFPAPTMPPRGSAPVDPVVRLAASPVARLAPARAGGWLWVAEVGLLIALLRLLRVLGEGWRLQRATSRRRPVTDRRALSLLDDLRARLRRPVAVRLTVSDGLASPLALWGREICLPPRALEGLDDVALRGVLAHELAHVERRDNLWLLVAALVDAVFFWQPLNRLARREGHESAELAADDRAVELTSDPLGLARSLAEVAGWGLAGGAALASPVVSARGPLLRRVERLLAAPPGGRRGFWKGPIAIAALAALALMAPAMAPAQEVASEAPAGEAGRAEAKAREEGVRLEESRARVAEEARAAERASAETKARAQETAKQAEEIAERRRREARRVAEVRRRVEENEGKAREVVAAATETVEVPADRPFKFAPAVPAPPKPRIAGAPVDAAPAPVKIAPPPAAPAAPARVPVPAAGPLPPIPPRPPRPPRAAMVGPRREHGHGRRISYALVGKDGRASAAGGETDDLREVAALTGKVHGEYLWVRRGGERLLISEGTSLDSLHALVTEQGELGKKADAIARENAEIAKQQVELTRKQAELAKKRAELDVDEAGLYKRRVDLDVKKMRLKVDLGNAGLGAPRELKRRLDELNRRQTQLGLEQDQLGHRQIDLGRRHEELGRMQGELGRQRGELGRMQGELNRRQGDWERTRRDLESKLRDEVQKIADEARAKGTAKVLDGAPAE